MAQVISETQLQACGFSDHLGVTTTMKVRTSISQCRGLWKLNSSMLGESEIKQDIGEVFAGGERPTLCWCERKYL